MRVENNGIDIIATSVIVSVMHQYGHYGIFFLKLYEIIY